jgi:hypothetical protein
MKLFFDAFYSAEPLDSPDTIYIHTTACIRRNEDVALTREGFLMYGILAGCGYSKVSPPLRMSMSLCPTDWSIQDGLPGCGAKMACRLALTEFSQQLFDAGKTLAGTELEQFMVSWCNDLRTELSTNEQGLLPWRNQRLASHIDDTFQPLLAVKLYTDPAVTGTTGHVMPDCESWKPRCVDATMLQRFCTEKFARASESQRRHILQKVAWPRMYVRRLLQVRFMRLRYTLADVAWAAQPDRS